MNQEAGKQRMSAMLSLRIPCDCQRLSVNSGKICVCLLQRVPPPSIRFQLKVEQLSQIVAQCGDERCVLPARTITGTSETVYTAIGLALHNNVALKGFKRAERYLNRVRVKPTWFRVVVVGAGWQVAD
jgi:hypothetical protein